jgi:hypothetical protein
VPHGGGVGSPGFLVPPKLVCELAARVDSDELAAGGSRPTRPLQRTTFAFAIVAAEGEALSGRRSREGQVSVGSLRVLPSVAGAPAPEVPRPDGTDRWRHAVGAQRGGVARSRCGDGRRVARRPRLPERRGEVELAARAPMITGGGLEALRATGETSPWRVIAALVTRGLAGRTDARGRGD